MCSCWLCCHKQRKQFHFFFFHHVTENWVASWAFSPIRWRQKRHHEFVLIGFKNKSSLWWQKHKNWIKSDVIDEAMKSINKVVGRSMVGSTPGQQVLAELSKKNALFKGQRLIFAHSILIAPAINLENFRHTLAAKISVLADKSLAWPSKKMLLLLTRLLSATWQ